MAIGQPNSIQVELAKLERQITFNKRVAWLLVAGGFLAASWGLRVFFQFSSYPPPLADLSSIGSYFQGAVGSLWSLAGLLFIYVAFLGQKQQLLLQRGAMEIQKEQFDQQQKDKVVDSARQDEELRQQQAQFSLQQDSIKRQNFENAFFQLLSLHSQNATQMQQRLQTHANVMGQKHTEEGRKCFQIWHGHLAAIFKNRATGKLPAEQASLELAVEAFSLFFDSRQGELSHYFRSLYHVVKFVKTSNVVPLYEDKRRYTSLVRAQLSAFELAILFYNGISPHGEKFKPLLEEFGFFEHLNDWLLLNPLHSNFYDVKAYK